MRRLSPRRGRRPEELVVFLGPSLPASAAHALGPCRVLPPARQGDVWRALGLRPSAIALVDGLFESTPSVWHHELLDALEAGVALFGGASMGALRAAELRRFGMVGVGRIFEAYRDGELVDDSEVALLHAGPEHGFRPLTLPLVNVRHDAERARLAGVLSRREADRLVAAAEAIFYQDRTWRPVLEQAGLAPRSRARWDAFAAGGLGDPKALDAAACIEAASDFVGAGLGRPLPPRAPAGRARSSLVRRRLLADGASRSGSGDPVGSSRVLAHLRALPESAALARAGLRRLLLAAWAEEHGLSPSPRDLAAAEGAWLRGLGVRDRQGFLAASGVDEGEVARIARTLALESLALGASPRLASDGPDPDEGLALEARLTGAWAAVARRFARRSRSGGGAR